jgi:hypothetical protein
MSVNLRDAGVVPRTSLIAVTPAMAQLWMQRNDQNRTLSKNLVNQLTQDILQGRWVMNGETIKFDREGRLIDGQHRLQAVIQSNTAVDMWVVDGLEPMSQMTIDIGRPRTAGSQLQIGNIPNANNVASIAACLIRWATCPHVVWGGQNMPSKAHIVEYAMQRAEDLNWGSLQGRQAYQASRIRVVAYATVAVAARAADLAEEWHAFHETLIVGANLSEGDPRLALRNYGVRKQTNMVGGAWAQQRDVAVVTKAFKAYCDGRDVRLLRFTRDEMPMPVL